MSKLGDKSAFSSATFQHPVNGEIYWGQEGMTLREYYIGQALQGELANNGSNYLLIFEEPPHAKMTQDAFVIRHRKLFAQRVLSAADAVLELMEQEPKP